MLHIHRYFYNITLLPDTRYLLLVFLKTVFLTYEYNEQGTPRAKSYGPVLVDNGTMCNTLL